ncbi:hypothetical protein MTO96_020265 [Rhipicephalus appendiculatus]
MVLPVSPVTYLVETRNTVRHVHVDHLCSHSSYQYAESNIGTEALRRPMTEDSAGHREAPNTPQKAHPKADTGERLPDDTTIVVSPPTGGAGIAPACGSRMSLLTLHQPCAEARVHGNSQTDTCLQISVTEDN